ncbi:hypothetical protein EXS61_00335 [Candidatus Parcubacteria bacterium]|nr:hypothetical protein [Candidatus Parcubacteria bacterium]
MKAKIIELKNERTMVWVTLAFVVTLLLLYVYFMNETVFTVAKRASLQQELALHTSKISQLEFKSISLRNNIDLALAYSLGFNDIKTNELRYISKTPTTALATLSSVQ